MHVECGLPDPCNGSWLIKSTLKGIERTFGNPTSRKAPVNPQLLLQIRQFLDLKDITDVMFMAACLVMFFGTFRKFNLMCNSVGLFSSRKQFIRSDFVQLGDRSIKTVVKWSKTIQAQERSFIVKLPYLGDHPLCPVSALGSAFKLVPLPDEAPAFVTTLDGTPMTAGQFERKFQALVAMCGYNKKDFSGHSFRRGSACWALQCGVPGEIVQQMGDWKSNAYLVYLDKLPQSVHDKYLKLFSDSLPSAL